jgi:hypothetical protein
MQFEQSDQFQEGLQNAHNLMAHLRAGGTLLPIRTGVRLDEGEVEYTQSEVDCLRYASVGDGSYNRTTFLGLGSLQALAVTALGSAAWNSHRRRIAEQDAAPRWRGIGRVGLTVTSGRILMFQHMTWESIWFQQVFQMVPQLEHYQLDILFEGAPAVRYHGPSVPFVSVMMFYLLYHQEVALPALGSG